MGKHFQSAHMNAFPIWIVRSHSLHARDDCNQACKSKEQHVSGCNNTENNAREQKGNFEGNMKTGTSTKPNTPNVRNMHNEETKVSQNKKEHKIRTNLSD